MRQTNSGFTLLEILVSLFIFAILATMAAIGLHSVLIAREHLKKTDNQLSQLAVAVTLMRRDINQVIARSIIDEDGRNQAAFVGFNQQRMRFTRAGFLNPLAMSPRSQLQRVAYRVNDHALVRATWDALDRPPNALRHQQVLLSHVRSVKFQYVGRKGELYSHWPPMGMNTVNPATWLPTGVIVTLMLQNQGVLQLALAIPAIGASRHE